MFSRELPGGGIEPPRPKRARDFKSRASAYSATPAFENESYHTLFPISREIWGGLIFFYLI